MNSVVRSRAVALVCPLVILLMAADWSRFRGPNGSAVSDETGLPATWGPTENIVWKTGLPGPGTSSPVTAGGKVFITCYTGYGVEGGEPGKPEDLQRHLLCLDRRDGRILWQRSVDARQPVDRADGFLMHHGYASSTPATDGERVYVMFGKSGVFAFDIDGEQLWQADVGTGSGMNGWGSASSPILHENLVIVNASAECSALVALDKLTGKQVWTAKAEGVQSWSTPVLADAGDGKQELVINMPYELWGFSLATGKLLWYVPTAEEDVICTSPVAHGQRVFVMAGRGGGSLAVRAGGRGDVATTHTLWKGELGSYVPSPVFYDGHLYWVSDRGMACCVNAETGEKAFEERLGDAGQVYASVVIADGKLYAVTRFNGTYVLAAKPQFERLAHNQLDDESSFNASPAISDGQLLLRSNRFCYCIGAN